MANNYWINRTERSAQAKRHTSDMETDYQRDIVACALQTKFFNNDKCNQELLDAHTPTDHKTKITLECTDSVSAIFNHKDEGRVCVLNFASFSNPGGMFLDGSSAQEESLCHESFLYNVLSRLYYWYEQNRTIKNRGLYQNRALYSPNIRFFHNGEETLSDVITCACPSWGAASKNGVTPEENKNAVNSRVEFLLKTAAINHPDVLILGAYGCGAFKQNPVEVATIMNEWVNGTFAHAFKHIVFAIPDETGENYQTFQRIIQWQE